MESEKIKSLKASAYKIPTDYPESDGTIKWDSTTLILVEIKGAGKTGLGYSYANEATAFYIERKLKNLVLDADIMDIPAVWQAMTSAVRNDGNCGIAAMAISAIDNALWDLKAKVLELPLSLLLGLRRPAMPIYGSGGFTSYPLKKLQGQLGKWTENGIRQVKMKIGREPEKDISRVKAARAAIGASAQLFVDANGAYDAKQSIAKAWEFIESGVSWFEEPVPSEDLNGLRFIRKKMPPDVKVAAGEYGYTVPYFEQMMATGSIDVLQADATRCGGISGFLKAADICFAHQLLFSSHCAPSLHLHAALSVPNFYTAEYFYDHVRIEEMLFDGVQKPINGLLYPDLSRPGIGLEFKYKDAKKYKQT